MHEYYFERKDSESPHGFKFIEMLHMESETEAIEHALNIGADHIWAYDCTGYKQPCNPTTVWVRKEDSKRTVKLVVVILVDDF